MHSLVRVVRGLGIAGILLTLGVGAYAFTATNTVPASRAGDGTGTVSGYSVSNIHYNLDVTTPTNIDAVTFTVDTAPVAGSTMKVQIAGNWYSCTNATTTLTCATTAPALTVGNTTSLEALIAQ
jgi:hypothetical protein